MPASAPAKKRPAKRLEARTVTVALTGDHEGWEATVQADFKAKYWADIYSGDPDRFIPVLTKVVVEHNFPDEETGELAETIGDVELSGMSALIEGMTKAIGALPPR
jgi:hypothetical protein